MKSNNKQVEFLKKQNAGRGNMDKFIDLHLHLDGAITVDIAKKLAALQGIELPTNSNRKLEKILSVSEDCEDLNEFLECFEQPLILLQTPEGISEAVRMIADMVQSQGVVYAEIRFAPQNHTQKGMTQEDAVLAALEGIKKTTLKTNLILCFMRGEENEDENEETFMLAKKYLVKDGGVVALDIAGAEGLFPTENYRTIFEKAHYTGIPFTIHAGEADGPESVRLAIEYGASRIGHGVRSKEDPEVLQMIKDKGIYLEMCPTSNRLTKAVEDMADYPLIEYLDQGIKVTINTDDMGIERTTMAKEFKYIEKKFGLTTEQENVLQKNAVDGAFTSDEVKGQLRQELGLAE